jgi:nucleoid DNA-binding protein
MRKIITLTAILLLVAGVGAAVDRHGPMKTGLFEVHPGDEAPDGEKVSEGTDIIYGKYAGTSSATEQDEYREGNEAKHEKKTRGQPTFDDLEMERGVKPGATQHDEFDSEDKRSARKGRNPQTGKEIKIPAKKVVKFKPGAELSEKVKALAQDGDMRESDIYATLLKIRDKESGEEYFVHATGLIDEIRDEDERSARREGNEAKHEKQAWATGGKDGGDYSASIANKHDGNVQTGKEIKIPAK